MKLTDEQKERNKFYSDHRYKNMKEMVESYELDEKKIYRIKSQQCKACYYLRSGFSTQAFTEYICGNCDEKNMWHNGDAPKYCDKCTELHGVCRRCGCEV